MARIALKVHSDDNVVTLLDSNESVRITGDGMVLLDDIPFGHKVATRPIPAGAAVIKYGVAIGIATRPIARGEHVHVHNCR